jgi:hypothetical protein
LSLQEVQLSREALRQVWQLAAQGLQTAVPSSYCVGGHAGRQFPSLKKVPGRHVVQLEGSAATQDLQEESQAMQVRSARLAK